MTLNALLFVLFIQLVESIIMAITWRSAVLIFFEITSHSVLQCYVLIIDVLSSLFLYIWMYKASSWSVSCLFSCMASSRGLCKTSVILMEGTQVFKYLRQTQPSRSAIRRQLVVLI